MALKSDIAAWFFFFFFSSRRRHTRSLRDWSSDVCSSDLTARPGIVIGRKGAEIDKLKGDISSRTGREVLVSIQEIHKPELNAQLQAEKIAAQLEKRIAFRRAMRKAVEESLRFGAQGIKVKVSGRLNGAEIARSEWHLQGQLPLHTLRADIDYGSKGGDGSRHRIGSDERHSTGRTRASPAHSTGTRRRRRPPAARRGLGFPIADCQFPIGVYSELGFQIGN